MTCVLAVIAMTVTANDSTLCGTTDTLAHSYRQPHMIDSIRAIAVVSTSCTSVIRCLAACCLLVANLLVVQTHQCAAFLVRILQYTLVVTTQQSQQRITNQQR
jgi:hypothetical protein